MPSVRNSNFPTIALLSVACDDGSRQDAANGAGRSDLAGASLIEYQITTLARAGIQRFLIEVENIDGVLIALADRCASRKLTVDFVRTGGDILRHINADDRIWVQSGQLYVQLGLVETLLKSTENFIATIDGRDENRAFERIDINTRWAGVSVVGYEAIAMLRDLPEDWSIISSLLRQALLAKVPFRPLSQQHVHNGTLTVLTGAQDFSELNRQILRRRVASRAGYIEAQLFGPILARLVPLIWQSPTAATATKFAAPVIALAALALGLGNLVTAATVAAFLSIAANALRLAVTDDADGSDHIQSLSVVTWTLIILTMFGSAYVAESYDDNGLFAAFAVASLAYLTHKMVMPGWAKQVLHSPAALALLAIIGAATVGITNILQWIMVLQLSVLMIASMMRDAEGKKSN
ncbi:MAG: hypothetical protein HEQ34_04435 [Sphingorhabdus sp.]|uniref:hypothetical protein n=1 Tax=Sphingorhabdus sp. TaxID=1902408 RepID=UPI0025FDB5E2|nr:hypothetical protein [Sphingorhabdus sp.]MCO4091187.1 hypothetical protein [Sphingorhabdus sp.]